MLTERIATPWRVVAAGLLLLTGLTAVALADLDVTIGNNTVVDAQIDPADEVETYRITVAAGSKVSVSAKAKPEKKATPVDLSMVVLDAADQVVATGTKKGKTVKVKGFVPTETGTYRVVVTGDGATTGAYQLKAKWKAPKKVKDEVQVGIDGVTFPFSAAPGSEATFKVKAGKGSAALPRLGGVSSTDDVYKFAAFEDAKEGSKSHKQKKVPLGSQRDYELTIENVGADGSVKVDVKLKSPKVSKTTVDVRDPQIGGGSAPGASGGKPATAFGGVIGPEGGSAQVDPVLGGVIGGTGIEVPAGAVSTPVAITFGEAVNGLPPPDGDTSGAGPTIFFGPAGLEFGIPATVTIPFDVEALAGGLEGIEIYARDEDGTVSLIPQPYDFDLEAGTCSFPASHFTSFRAFDRAPPITLENERVVVPQAAQAGDAVGTSVALDGNTLVIGVPLDDTNANDAGAVYVFVRSGNSWVLEQRLDPRDSVAGGQFGTDVALLGDFIAVGAPGAQDFQQVDSGAVYLYDRFQGTWFENQKLIGSQRHSGSRFGQSLDYDGTTLVIGAPFETEGNMSRAGSVYRFEPFDGLLEDQRVTMTTPMMGALFGTDVALATNDRVVVGAAGAQGGGRAFVFDRDGQLQLQQTAELFHGETSGSEAFGARVDAEGDLAIVSDPGFDDPNAADSGAAYAFSLNGTWSQEARLTELTPTTGNAFGSSLTYQSGLLIAGLPGSDATNGADAGSVNLFQRNGRVWTFIVRRYADTPVPGEGMGAAAHISTNGELAVGGIGQATTTGTVFVYDIVTRLN